MIFFKNFFKYIIGLIIVLFFRFIPLPPNVEPIMSTMMPFSKKWGIYAGLLFTFLAMIVFDLVTKTLGVWSILTIGTYLLITFFAGIYFKNRKKVKHYVIFAIIGTIFYDLVTGLVFGVLIFNQGVIETLILQIPFTINHLVSNIILSALVSPLLYQWVISNPKFETNNLLNYFKNINLS